MANTFKFYLPLVVIFALCIFGLFAPVIYSDVYGEILNNSPTLYMPMVNVDYLTSELCSDPTKLHYVPCGLDDLTPVA